MGGYVIEVFKQTYQLFSSPCLCLPSSKQEGPTVLEAMSYGVPIVAYNIDGLPELVRHEQDGLLVPVADKRLQILSLNFLQKLNSPKKCQLHL